MADISRSTASLEAASPPLDRSLSSPVSGGKTAVLEASPITPLRTSIPGSCRIHKVVLTGGPCGGKTTALARLSNYLMERGFRVFTVPEAATLFFQNGFSPATDLRADTAIEFQSSLLLTQMHLEDTMARLAAATGCERAVLLCDRGAMDGKAYVPTEEEWNVILETASRRRATAGTRAAGAPLSSPDAPGGQLRDRAASESGRASPNQKGGDVALLLSSPDPDNAELILASLDQQVGPDFSEVALRDQRYDAVCHLVTCANGAPKFYGTATNETRYESLEEAQRQDLATQRVWLGHPNLSVFQNDCSFETKMQRLVARVSHVVGVPITDRISRKFLVTKILDKLNAAIDPLEKKLAQLPVPAEVFEVEKIYPRQQGPTDESEGYTFARKRTSAQNGVSSYRLTIVKPRQANQLSPVGPAAASPSSADKMEPTPRTKKRRQMIELKRIISSREYREVYRANLDPTR